MDIKQHSIYMWDGNTETRQQDIKKRQECYQKKLQHNTVEWWQLFT
jgi:hypothetical protein